MRHLTIVNQTHWQTKHLRSIALRALAMVLEPEQGKFVTIKFVYTRQHYGSSGCAGILSRNMRVRLPKPTRNRKDLAMVIAHEAAHAVLGLNHDKMRGNSYYNRVGRYDELYEWAESMPLEVKPKVKKARPALSDKVAKADAAVKKWERKLKLAQTKLKIWKKKVKYYEKRTEKIGPLSPL